LKDTLRIVLNAIGWLVLLAALGSMGFLCDNPEATVPGYTIFFLACFLLSYLYQKTHKKHNLDQSKSAQLIRKIMGVFLILGSVLAPYKIFNSLWPGYFNGFFSGKAMLLTVICLALIAIAGAGIMLLNKTKGNNTCLLYTSPSPRDVEESRMPSSA